MRQALWIGALLGLAACRSLLGFEDPVVRTPDAPADAPDDSLPPDAGLCTTTSKECVSPDVLRSCTIVGQVATDQVCGWGCRGGAAGPHCGELLPAGGVVQSPDLAAAAGLEARTIAAPTTINTVTGSIPGLRGEGPGVINGIAFTVRSGVGIFAFGGLTVNGAVTVVGGNALAILTHGDLVVNGVIDLRAGCTGAPTPGGGAGGGGGLDGAGGARAGGGGASGGGQSAGGGGGGYGDAGGRGGDGGAHTGPPGGAAAGGPEIAMLLGGGGGGGGGGSQSANPGAGGAGGGALQIASNGLVVFGEQALGGVNAGGCGGRRGASSTSSGGGGGAGGTILIQAPRIRLADTGRLAVNGGGGGASRMGGDGAHGGLDAAAAMGGTGGTGGGGGGGATANLRGGAGGSAANNGGGGGGAVGRIRLETRDGAVELAGAPVISPALDAAGSTATQGTAQTQ